MVQINERIVLDTTKSSNLSETHFAAGTLRRELGIVRRRVMFVEIEVVLRSPPLTVCYLPDRRAVV